MGNEEYTYVSLLPAYILFVEIMELELTRDILFYIRYIFVYASRNIQYDQNAIISQCKYMIGASKSDLIVLSTRRCKDRMFRPFIHALAT